MLVDTLKSIEKMFHVLSFISYNCINSTITSQLNQLNLFDIPLVLLCCKTSTEFETRISLIPSVCKQACWNQVCYNRNFVRAKLVRTKLVTAKIVITKFLRSKFVRTEFFITKLVVTKFVRTNSLEPSSI